MDVVPVVFGFEFNSAYSAAKFGLPPASNPCLDNSLRSRMIASSVPGPPPAGWYAAASTAAEKLPHPLC